MSEAPSYLDRSRMADFLLTLRVGADEDGSVLVDTIAAMLGRELMYRDPKIVHVRPDRTTVLTAADADQALADQLQPMTEAEQATFRLLKARARLDDGRLLLVRVHHQGRNRALVVLVSPVGGGASDLHALALLADADLLAEIHPAR